MWAGDKLVYNNTVCNRFYENADKLKYKIIEADSAGSRDLIDGTLSGISISLFYRMVCDFV